VSNTSAVAAGLDRAVKKDDMLTTFGPVLHDPDGEVFWLNPQQPPVCRRTIAAARTRCSADGLHGFHHRSSCLFERHFYGGTLHEPPGIIRPRVGELYAFWATDELYLALAHEVAVAMSSSRSKARTSRGSVDGIQIAAQISGCDLDVSCFQCAQKRQTIPAATK